MTIKEKFVREFEKASGGQHPKTLKDDPKRMAAILTANQKLRTLFRDAVTGAMEGTEPAEGLSLLFPTD